MPSVSSLLALFYFNCRLPFTRCKLAALFCSLKLGFPLSLCSRLSCQCFYYCAIHPRQDSSRSSLPFACSYTSLPFSLCLRLSCQCYMLLVRQALFCIWLLPSCYSLRLRLTCTPLVYIKSPGCAPHPNAPFCSFSVSRSLIYLVLQASSQALVFTPCRLI